MWPGRVRAGHGPKAAPGLDLQGGGQLARGVEEFEVGVDGGDHPRQVPRRRSAETQHAPVLTIRFNRAHPRP